MRIGLEVENLLEDLIVSIYMRFNCIFDLLDHSKNIFQNKDNRGWGDTSVASSGSVWWQQPLRDGSKWHYTSMHTSPKHKEVEGRAREQESKPLVLS